MGLLDFLSKQFVDVIDWMDEPGVLAIRYPSREAIEQALASPVRFESREVTKGLTEMFDGSIFHTVFKADDFVLPTD